MGDAGPPGDDADTGKSWIDWYKWNIQCIEYWTQDILTRKLISLHSLEVPLRSIGAKGPKGARGDGGESFNEYRGQINSPVVRKGMEIDNRLAIIKVDFFLIHIKVWNWLRFTVYIKMKTREGLKYSGVSKIKRFSFNEIDCKFPKIVKIETNQCNSLTKNIGEHGEKGFKGPMGDKGTRGSYGLTGLKGERGIKGSSDHFCKNI